MYFNGAEWQELTNNLDEVLNNFSDFTISLSKLNKPNNNAPKSIKGDYDLSIHGNKIVLVDNNDGTTVEAKCHPDDNFDIGAGIKEAFKKLNEKREEIRKQKEEEEKKIKVGDWVEVVNSGGGSYPGRTSFFDNLETQKYASHFRFGVVPENGTVGKVVYVDDTNPNFNFYLIQEVESPCYGEKKFNHLTYNNGIYLVSDDGIKKVAKPRA